MYFRFHPVEAKNFQSKFKKAEEYAMKHMLPGAHNGDIGSEGENIP